jgi:glycerophosphoryl diester phosphodiesterase
LDVGMTADGIVVVSHDLALNPVITRDAAGNWLSGNGPLLRHLTFDALRFYDVGRIRPATPYRLLHRSQRGRDGVRIPTLEEVLLLSSATRCIIELKTDPRYPDQTATPTAMANAVLEVVDRVGAAGRVIIESFDWRGPRHVRRIRPELQTAWLTRDETVRDAALWWDGLTPADFANSIPAAVAAQGGGIWAPACETVTRASVAEAHGLGLRVIPWTVNRRSVLRRMINRGVDGVITDRPDIAFAVIAER